MLTDEFPRIFTAKQRFDGPHCADVAQAVSDGLNQSTVATSVKPGESVAITAGSRGITNIAKIIKATAGFFQGLGANPFVVPAMGSHGGGTAEGQRRVIESYGITEEYCGCPIKSSMETVVIGKAKEGFPIFFDRFAHQADHVVVCGRIKPHTNFTGDIQSGLMKMMMIGLGKEDGASLYHRAIQTHGFPQIIRSVAPKVIEHANILLGLAIVENADDETAHLEVVSPDDFCNREAELLTKARMWLPKLPFQDIDVLLIDQIGKNISGTGMDTNVIGRKHSEVGLDQPNVQKIALRGLTPETHGNAAGLGFADFCLTRLVEDMDRDATVLNCLTALDVSGAKIPVHYATDREVISAALTTVGLRPRIESRLVWIQNTGHLTKFACSEAFADEVASSPSLEATGDPHAMPIGENGMLPDDFFQMR